MSQVVSLSEALELDVSQVGGKARRLAELDAAGLRVPPAFVITTEAFVQHFQRIDAGALLDGVDAPDAERLAALRELALTPELVASIETAHRRLARRLRIKDADLTCAVRSSGTEEDSDAVSFAGQHATYYYTRREELPQRVVDCWLSCWSGHAAGYRAATGASPPRLAVLIQQMILADVSGVTFTRDPTDPDNGQLVIESCWGLGAALVDGRVDPDRYHLDRADHRVRSTRIGTKRFKVSQDPIDPESARLEAVPRHLQRTSTLSAAQLAEVATLSGDCEAHYGKPQDVEWAIGDGKLHLLQSRPVTLAAPPGAQVEGRWVIFKPIVENFTEALTPLTVDIVRRVIPPFGRFIDGRFYLNFDAFRALLPYELTDAQVTELALLHPVELPPVSPRRLWLPVLAALWGYLSWGTLLVRTRHLPSQALAGFRARCEAILADDRIDALAATQRLLLGVSPVAPAGHLAFQINVSSARYFVLLDVLRALLNRYAPEFDPDLISILCSGSSDMLSTRMIEDLGAVVAAARDSAPVRRVFADVAPEELSARLAADPEARRFTRALEAFLADYGHRGTREVELAAPRWQEDPTPLLAMIRNMLDAASPNLDRGAVRRADAERALRQAFANGLPRRLAQWLIRRIRHYAALRENTRYFHVMGLTTIRLKILELERALIVAGALTCPDDVFYLTWDEVQALRNGTLDPRAASVRVRERRVEHIRRCQRPPPNTFNIEATAAAEPVAMDLSGQCASPGSAEGLARVVLDPGTDATLAPGEILVAPYTDPAWTPLFLNAAAIIVEVGSYLSHAGTVAREYGVPCIVDVHGCTKRLTTGQRLRVDATRGRIHVLSPADAADTAVPPSVHEAAKW